MNTDQTAKSPRCPYKGLEPYTEEDRAYFFGRERDQEIIASNLYAVRLTVLYGPSGVGKSSVLRAGVAPQLEETPRTVLVYSRDWQDPDPLPKLKNTVLSAVRQKSSKDVSLDPDLPFDEFLLGCRQALHGPVLFVFDQFEEYFLYHSQQAGRFDTEFARAVNRSEIGANFLLSMREDGISKLDRFRGRIPNLLSNLLPLEHLDRQAAISAIRKPLYEYNVRLPIDQQPVAIEDELVEELIFQVRTGKVTLEQGGGQAQVRDEAQNDARIETPFLQMVLTRLWDEEVAAGSDRLRMSTFERLGGAESIVRTHLDKVMLALREPERFISSRIFRFLVTPDGAKIALNIPVLAGWAEIPPGEVAPVLEKLSCSEIRILRPVEPPANRPGELRYEVYHDVLAKAILDWRARFVQAQELAEAERRGQELLAREREEGELQLRAQEQQRRIGEQQRRAEEQAAVAARLRRFVVALSIASLLAAVAAILALVARNAARANHQRAAAAETRAEINEHKAFGALKERDALDAYDHGYLTVALAGFKEALSEYRLAADPVREASTLKNIGQIEFAQGNYREAEERFKQALHVYRSPGASAGPTIPAGGAPLLALRAEDLSTYASLLVSLASVNRAQHQYKQAEAHLKDALEILKSGGPLNPLAAEVSCQVASVYVDQGQYEKAEPLFKQALPVLEDAYGPEGANADYASILESYAVLLRKTYRNGDAAQVEKQARAIRNKLK
jgi:tetratricopeptide (TPR) repeat protein